MGTSNGRLLQFVQDRQTHGEFAASARPFAASVNRALMHLDQSLDDRQPDTQATEDFSQGFSHDARQGRERLGGLIKEYYRAAA